MNIFKKFISIIFNTRFIGILSTVYGLLSFIRDEFLPVGLADKLRLGGVFKMIDWYWWVIFGVIIWAISVALESAKRHDASNLQVPEIKKVARSKNTIGSQKANQINNYFGNGQKQEEANQKQSSQKETNTNWDDVKIDIWEKKLSENEVRGGVIIKNDKDENIEKLYVEITEIYDEDGLGLYGQRQAELPRTAGWEIDGKVFYGETEITVGKRKYLALAYESWIISGSSYFFIGGNNRFQHHMSINETYVVELEIAGVVKGVQLKPITKFVIVHFNGKTISIKDISNELPKKL